jgi:hypothetical protein
VRIELHHCKVAVAVQGRRRADVRIRDRVIPAQDNGDRAGFEHRLHRRANRLVGREPIAGNHLGISVIDDDQSLEGIDTEIHVVRLRIAPGVVAVSNLAGAEARARPVRREVVHRRPDDHDVRAGELGRVQDERDLLERGGTPRISGLPRPVDLHARASMGADIRPANAYPVGTQSIVGEKGDCLGGSYQECALAAISPRSRTNESVN